MIAQLGKYEIRRELGRGAMGVVYEAYDPMIRRRVALKTIRPDQLDGERPDDVVARFRREAQAAGRLNHPNIVSIYDCDEDGGTWFIAMEFIEGRDLRERFAADERFRTGEIERIMQQILAALDYSHRQGVVHRDIKPANIFLMADGTVKVADFGIAHIEASNLTQVGTVVGMPNYMSPEQIIGAPVDGRSDLFSAGVILYQFLTGERPFAGSSTATMQKVLKEDPLPPSTLNVQLPPAIDAVVRKALAKRADERFGTAQAFAVAIAAAMPAHAHGLPHVDDPDATLPSAGPVATPPTRNAFDSATNSPKSGLPPSAGSPRTAVALVVALAIIGVTAVVATGWLWPRSQATAPAIAASTPSAPPSNANASGAVVSGPAATAPAPAALPPGTAAAATTAAVEPAEPGHMVISAVGLADPTAPRYANDRALLATDLRADSKQQLVEKALVMLLDRKSFATNYDVLRPKSFPGAATSYARSFVRASPAWARMA